MTDERVSHREHQHEVQGTFGAEYEHVTVTRYRRVPAPLFDVLICEFFDPTHDWKAKAGHVYHYFDPGKQGQIKAGDIVSICTPLEPDGARAVVREVQHREVMDAAERDVQILLRVDA